eukprot:3681969-Ditylum_brightwellii.AAC.1
MMLVEVMTRSQVQTGQIPDAISNLTELMILDLHDNDLTWSITSAIRSLLNLLLSVTMISQGTSLKSFNLSELELIHIYASRLQGVASHLVLKGVQNEPNFIAGCGSPSYFHTPLYYPDCTMYYNTNNKCDVTEELTEFIQISKIYIGPALLILLLISPF